MIYLFSEPAITYLLGITDFGQVKKIINNNLANIYYFKSVSIIFDEKILTTREGKKINTSILNVLELSMKNIHFK